MSCYSLDAWKALRFLGTENARAHETKYIVCLSGRNSHSQTINMHSWRKMKREGWVEVDPDRHDPSEGWTVWKLSPAGQARCAALTVGEKKP